MLVVWAWCGLLSAFGCGAWDEPILSGVRAPGETQIGPQRAPYQRPEGVMVDLAWLGGRPWEEARDLISEQLGDIRAVEKQEGGLETVYTLERGRVNVVDDRVNLLYVELPRPMRRAAALQALNLPVTVDSWFVLSGEFRLRWEAGFERIRMGRVPEDPDRVTWVEARKWDPRSSSQR